MYVKYETDEEELQKKIWDNIHNELKKELGLVAYKSWLIRLKIVGFTLKESYIYRFPQNF